MAKIIEMPKLGATMEKGTLIKWLVNVGDFVENGDPIAEVQTEKIVQEIEVDSDGYLLSQLINEGEEIPVFTPIAHLGAKNEQVALHESTNQPQAVLNQKIKRTPAARRLAQDNAVDLNKVNGTGRNGLIVKKDVEAQLAKQLNVTPLAQKIIDAKKIDMSELENSTTGKIRKADVLNLIHDETPAYAEEYIGKKLEGMRKVIADNISQSFYSAPHVTMHVEVNVDPLINLRNQLLPIIEQDLSLRISYTELFIKATEKALIKHPTLNQTIVNDEIHAHKDISIGLAVALDDGLVVPVIHKVNNLTVKELTKTVKKIAKSAREGKLSPDYYQGSTFTISNLGMYEVDGFTPIINQPNTAILGIGRMTKKPVVIDDEISIGTTQNISLSFDHRVIDGAPAAAFLTDLKYILEHPLEALL